MAKLKYSKPLFGIRPIPLANGGGTGGCKINPTNGPYVCAIRDEFGDLIFTDEDYGCEVLTQSGEATICYTVYDNDFTVYAS